MVSLHVVAMFVSGQMKGVNIKRNAENVVLKKTRNLTKMRIHGNQRKGTKYSKTEVLARNQKKETENKNDVNMDSKDSDTHIKSDNEDSETPEKETESDNQDGANASDSKTDSKDIDTDNKSENQDIENKDNEAPQTSHQEGSDE